MRRVNFLVLVVVILGVILAACEPTPAAPTRAVVEVAATAESPAEESAQEPEAAETVEFQAFYHEWKRSWTCGFEGDIEKQPDGTYVTTVAAWVKKGAAGPSDYDCKVPSPDPNYNWYFKYNVTITAAEAEKELARRARRNARFEDALAAGEAVPDFVTFFAPSAGSVIGVYDPTSGVTAQIAIDAVWYGVSGAVYGDPVLTPEQAVEGLFDAAGSPGDVNMGRETALTLAALHVAYHFDDVVLTELRGILSRYATDVNLSCFGGEGECPD